MTATTLDQALFDDLYGDDAESQTFDLTPITQNIEAAEILDDQDLCHLYDTDTRQEAITLIIDEGYYGSPFSRIRDFLQYIQDNHPKILTFYKSAI